LIEKLPNIKRIILSNDFEDELIKFPNTLTHLYINDKYDKRVINIESSLKYLRIGRRFNFQNYKMGTNIMLNGLYYDDKIWNKELDHKLIINDKSWNSLIEYNINNYMIIDKLPPNIKKLKILLTPLTKLYEFPNKIEKLEINIMQNVEIPILPESLEDLTITGNLTKDFPKLPSNLKKLKFKILYLFENNPRNPLPEYSIFEFLTATEKDILLFS
jgi:hypothetical protein